MTRQEQRPKLKAVCRWCAGRGKYDMVMEHHIVRCAKCGASGPWADSPAAAAATWDEYVRF